MAAGTLTVESTTVSAVRPGSWPRILFLHLAPGVAVMIGYLVLLPVARSWSLPPAIALSTAVLLIGVPLEIGLLGGVAFRRRLPAGRFAAAVASCLALAGGLYVVLPPLPVVGWLPDSWFVGGGASVSRGAMIAALLVSLVVDGLISPAVQEAYFRGYLMPRLPVAAALAPVVSAGLFAVQHLWQPHLVLFIFVVQAMLGLVVWRTGCLAVSIVVHSACNVLATMATLLIVLAA